MSADRSTDRFPGNQAGAGARWRRFARPDTSPPGAVRAVLVIGLGRFGSSLGRTLVGMGLEVLGVDSDAALVQQYAPELTQTVQADCTNVDALRQIGAHEFTHAAVAIGSDLEASILTVAALDDLGVPNIWAKAVTPTHARILERVGAGHVVLPESEMGQRVAHLLAAGRMIDYLALDDNFVIVEAGAPAELVGRSLVKAQVRQRLGVTVVCIKPAGGAFTYATADTVVGEGDVLVVAGLPRAAEAFAALP